jgi:hypothetical protein
MNSFFIRLILELPNKIEPIEVSIGFSYLELGFVSNGSDGDLRDLKVDFDERLNLFFEGFDKFF